MNNTPPVKEFILCAAIHYKDGKVHTHQPVNIESGLVVCGMRHCNCFSIVAGLLGNTERKVPVGPNDQGFITSLNRYVDRKEGYHIAYGAKQIKVKSLDDPDPELYSEDLY